MSSPSSYFEHYTLGTFSPHVRERQLVCSSGVWMLEIMQPAGAFPDPPVPDFVVQRDLRGASAAVDFGAGKFRIKPEEKSIVVAPPMSASSFFVDNAHHVRALAIPVARLSRWIEKDGQPGEETDLGRVHATGLKNVFIEQLMDRLWDDAAGDKSASLLHTDALLLTLWSELLREAKMPVKGLVKGGLAPWQVRRCTEYLHDHISEPVGLEQLAALVALSPFHFARAFRQSTGLPPHRYQQAIRIARAKALLEATDLPVTDIAFDVGYTSSQALARLFRRQVGVSPSDYRRQNRG